MGGFWGLLLVGRGRGRALIDCPVLAARREHLVPAAVFAGGWQVWRHPDRPAGGGPCGPGPADSMDALVRTLADETGAPALAAHVMAGDCAVIGGARPAGASWSACLGRPALTRHLADTGLGLDELFPTPRVAAAHCAAWAAAAGHVADPGELADVLAADAGPAGVEDLFHELLARLGMVARVAVT